MHELFTTGNIILKTLESHGHKGYFVGGCVRDHHMGRTINDVDITTDALPEDIERIFEHTIDVGKEHGTIIVLVEDTPFEVTTFRTESEYSDFRRPDQVIFTRDLYSDLERRDFTMNAMAMNDDFTIIDPYDGMDAISHRMIATVGLASERFNEDALRILRAARFSSQLQFEVAEETRRAMAEHAENLRHVAVERSVTELTKLYLGMDPKRGKVLVVDTRLNKYLPFFDRVDDASFLRTDVRSLEDELALQIHLSPELAQSLSALKLSNAVKSYIGNIIRLLDMVDSASIRELAYGFDTGILANAISMIQANGWLETGDRRAHLQSALTMKPALPIADASEIDLDGHALMTLFNARGGRWIRTVLTAVEQEILYGRLENDRYKIIEWVKAHVEFEAGDIKITEK
ncbi:CCA tRNA nucleotidyltransferase [Salinicoccus sp. ID82-1]|uniref:CCA tRNA nucleotidyltransferase n=1 Tax=Salinicoccus sp. ID82-1 TaxID=2820269 RepID=UPI001F00C0AE|nr:CCA tRNA nucleotidyltransferase [Salinicoccus sp. ID82-1]MCG1009107.1 CCA tRNA nucleotidyltransferase [Salinicoccus sp. ID82-1]